VTAERGPQPLADAIPQTTRFDQQDIADTTARDMPGLLQLAPGAQIVRNGGPGSSSSLFLRGASAQQSLVLIDGVRVDSVSLGSAQIEQIPLDQVDHVEVVNGNVSALYGSGAIGGVVQVFTKDGGDHPPRFNFSVGYGSYHTQSQQAGVNGALDRDGATTFSLSLARTKDDGFSSIDPALAPVNPNANGYLNESISASLRHTFNDRWDAGIRYFQSNGNISFDDPFGAPTDLNNLYSRVQQASVFANGRVTDWWTTHFVIATGNDRSTTALNGLYTDHFNTDISTPGRTISRSRRSKRSRPATSISTRASIRMSTARPTVRGLRVYRLYGALRRQPVPGQRAARPVLRFRRREQLPGCAESLFLQVLPVEDEERGDRRSP
jgi:vitamin B12 transporter